MNNNTDEPTEADHDATIDADPELLARLKSQAAAQQAPEHEADHDATTDADPELLAQLKSQAAAQQAPEHDATIDADPELLAQLKSQAAAQQAQKAPEHDATLNVGDDTDEADDDLLADLRQRAEHSQSTHASEVHEDVVEPSVLAQAAQVPGPQDDGESTATSTVVRDAVPSNSASAFVRQAREGTETISDVAPSTTKKKRNGLVVLVAIVLGAQILAAGAFFTLRSLQSDDQTEAVAETTEGGDLAAIVPTPIPAGATAVPLSATPTPVPPTPVWQPTNQGPRTNPFSFGVEAIVNEPTFFDGPAGSTIVPDTPFPLTSPRESGEPLVLRVSQGEPGDDWAQVTVPGSDDPVWVDTSDFSWRSSNTSIQIDLSVNLIRIFEGNEILHIGSVASGRLDNPTRQLVTWAIESPTSSRTTGDSESVVLLAALNDRGNALTIELSSGSIEQDGYVTDGTVRVTGETAEAIAEHLVAGSIIEFVGTPPRPTPTPIPTPTPNPESLGNGGSQPGSSNNAGCPQQGTPPNCYRVVERQTVPGACEDFQVQIDGSCFLFGGDINRFDSNAPICPSAAPEEIDSRCYKRIGQVPELPGDCPPEAEDVAGECRI